MELWVELYERESRDPGKASPRRWHFVRLWRTSASRPLGSSLLTHSCFSPCPSLIESLQSPEEGFIGESMHVMLLPKTLSDLSLLSGEHPSSSPCHKARTLLDPASCSAPAYCAQGSSFCPWAKLSSLCPLSLCLCCSLRQQCSSPHSLHGWFILILPPRLSHSLPSLTQS